MATEESKQFFLLGRDRAGGKGVCGRFMSPAREIPVQRGRVNRYVQEASFNDCKIHNLSSKA